MIHISRFGLKNGEIYYAEEFENKKGRITINEPLQIREHLPGQFLFEPVQHAWYATFNKTEVTSILTHKVESIYRGEDNNDQTNNER